MSEIKNLVSVIVPTYNRAALLGRTLPSYLQPETGELIVVDDCSTDDTPSVLAAFAATDPRVVLLRSERNLKQTHAKNMGIDAARFDYVYFGDDDSILLEGSLRRLLATMAEKKADIVGARAPYMESAEHEADPAAFAASIPLLEGALVSPVSLRTAFHRPTPGPVAAPFVHAAFLAPRKLAARLRFDEDYIGNCFREETDFLVRAKAEGRSLWFEPRAVQINLPRAVAAGGAHGGGGAPSAAFGAFVRRKLRYFSEALRNNRRFLKKNAAALDIAFGVHYPAFLRQFSLAWDIVRVIASYPFRKVFRHGR